MHYGGSLRSRLTFNFAVDATDSHISHGDLKVRPLCHLMRGRRVHLEGDFGERRSGLHQRADFNRDPQTTDCLGRQRFHGAWFLLVSPLRIHLCFRAFPFLCGFLISISLNDVPNNLVVYTHVRLTGSHDPQQLLIAIVTRLDNETANGPKANTIK